MSVAFDQLLTLSQAASALCISLRQIRRLVDSGRLAVVRITERTPRVRMSDLQAFIASSIDKRTAAPGA